MRIALAATAAVFLLAAGPAQARSNTLTATVIATHVQRGTVVLANQHGLAISVRMHWDALRLGDRVQLRGLSLVDGMLHAGGFRVVTHVRTATIRGMVVRALHGTMFVATGHDVLAIHRFGTRRLASAADDGQQPGAIGTFQVRFDHDDLVENTFTPGAPAVAVQIEGTVVSVSPLVVSVEGLPVTITIPSGIALPAGVTAGQQIELAVQAGTGNTFTLVAFGEPANAGLADDEEEVEATGSVVTSTTTQLVINTGSAVLTFAAPAGTTLPVLTAGTSVEVRGVSVNGTLILERVKAADENGDGNDGVSGTHDGGGDDGGGD